METTDSSYSLTTSKLPQESSVECAIPDASLSAPEEREYLLGWKLHALTLGLVPFCILRLPTELIHS